MTKHEKIDGRTRVANHRAAMRAKGYRLKQFWVPDTRTPEFQETARREALAIANSPYEAEEQAWVDEISRGVWEGSETERASPGKPGG